MMPSIKHHYPQAPLAQSNQALVTSGSGMRGIHPRTLHHHPGLVSKNPGCQAIISSYSPGVITAIFTCPETGSGWQKLLGRHDVAGFPLDKRCLSQGQNPGRNQDYVLS